MFSNLTPEAGGLPRNVSAVCDLTNATYIAVCHGLDVVHTIRRRDGVDADQPPRAIAQWLNSTRTVVNWDRATGQLEQSDDLN